MMISRREEGKCLECDVCLAIKKCTEWRLIAKHRTERDLCDLVWKDLYSKGLVNTDSLQVMMTGGGMITRRTTVFGRSFISFIRNPLEETF